MARIPAARTPSNAPRESGLGTWSMELAFRFPLIVFGLAIIAGVSGFFSAFPIFLIAFFLGLHALMVFIAFFRNPDGRPPKRDWKLILGMSAYMFSPVLMVLLLILAVVYEGRATPYQYAGAMLVVMVNAGVMAWAMVDEGSADTSGPDGGGGGGGDGGGGA